MNEQERNRMFNKLYVAIGDEHPGLNKEDALSLFIREALYGMPVGAVPKRPYDVLQEEIYAFEDKVSHESR